MAKTPRYIALCTSALALTALISGCVGPTESVQVSANAPEGLISSGKLTVCNSVSNYPPMYMAEDGELVGFDIDVVKAIADRWEVEADFQRASFDGLIASLDAGRCDILISAMFMNEQRLKVVDAVPYMQTGAELAVPAGNPKGISKPEDLAGLRIAVQTASTQELIANELNATLEADGLAGIDIQAYPEVTSTVAALQNGKADAFIETDVAMSSLVALSQNKIEAVPGLFPPTDTLGIFLTKENGLKEALSEMVKELAADGTLQEIANEYGLDPGKVIAE